MGTGPAPPTASDIGRSRGRGGEGGEDWFYVDFDGGANDDATAVRLIEAVTDFNSWFGALPSLRSLLLLARPASHEMLLGSAPGAKSPEAYTNSAADRRPGRSLPGFESLGAAGR